MPTIDFTLPTDTGDRLSLSSLRGRRVVLYFYPKDDTSGCTRESCEFRDMFPRFGDANAVILGISPDSVKSHQQFKKKYDLPFTLLVDENHALAEQLGLWVEKSFYGRKYMGVQRATYIIGPDGQVEHVFPKVNPAGHAEEVMAYLRGGPEAAKQARAEFDAAVSSDAGAAAPSTAKRDAQKLGLKGSAKKAGAGKASAGKKVAKTPAKRSATTSARKGAGKTAAKKATKKAGAGKAAAKPAKKAGRRTR